MLIFFLLAAGLVVLVLALMLPAMVRNRASAAPDRNELNLAIVREQLAEVESRLERGEIGDQEWRDERERLERDLAVALQSDAKSGNRGQWLMWPLAAALPVAAGAMYITLGTPVALQPPPPSQVVAGNAQQSPQSPHSPDMRDVIDRITQRVEQQPDDAEAWFMLGRAYMNISEFDKAAQALRRSHDVVPDNTEVMVRLADALAMTRNGEMRGEPTQLLARTLDLDPQHPQALWMMGLAKRDLGDYAGAIISWEKLVEQLQSDPRSQQEVRQLIAQAQTAITAQGGSAPQAPATAVEQTPDGSSLTVSVSLGDGVPSDMDPRTAVFVYARAMQGPPMPLAVVRRTVGDLPFSVTLSESDAMMAGMGLGSAEQLVVGARISYSGQAIAQSGDIMGEVDGVDHRAVASVSVALTDTVP